MTQTAPRAPATHPHQSMRASPRVVILNGPAGVGKTTTARLLAKSPPLCDAGEGLLIPARPGHAKRVAAAVAVA